MIIGDKLTFAIESGITKAYERPSFLALGFFVIHIQGYSYGVREPDASMLSCSVGEVVDRLSRRGKHTAFFATEPDAGKIADAFRDGIYAPNQEEKLFFGLSQPNFSDLIYRDHLIWAPDGDEAFDDGSYVLQFDVENSVRLIGFRSLQEEYHDHDPRTLSDLWLGAGSYYKVLEEWLDAFGAEWDAAPKISESEDGAEIQ